MARGPPVTTKPDGEAGGFCGDRRPEGHVFHTSRQAMIKIYYSTSIRKNMVQNCSYFTQMKSTTTAIDDSNRRRNKLGLGSRCACLLDSGGTIWLLWVYRDPVGIKIDSVGTSRRKWPVPKLYRLMYLHILMSVRLKGGKLLPPSSEDNTCVARKCIPYFLAFILNTCARAQN